MAVAAAVLACGSQVSAQADPTACETAYNTADGTANCGGLSVSVGALVCGQNFNRDTCVAKWKNGAGENEWYFFMGAGSGMDKSMLPLSCSGIGSGLAMVQYYPDKLECYPAAVVAGTTATYKQQLGGMPTSITLNFGASTDSGGIVRNGYLKVACSATENGFTTIGDSQDSSFFEVDTSAPCSGGPGPAPKSGYICLDNHCKPSNMTSVGVPLDVCNSICGTAALKYKCIDNKCTPHDNGIAYENCQQACLGKKGRRRA